MLFLANSVTFGFLTLIWTKKNWFNFLLKGLFFALTIANVVRFVRG